MRYYGQYLFLGMLCVGASSCAKRIGLEGFIVLDTTVSKSSLVFVEHLPETVKTPVQDAHVELLDETGKKIDEMRSHRSGYFLVRRIEGAKAGIYRLRVTRSNYNGIDIKVKLEINENRRCLVYLKEQ